MLGYAITALIAAAVTAVIVFLFNFRSRSSSNDNGGKVTFFENSFEEERAARIKSDEEVVRLKKEVYWYFAFA